MDANTPQTPANPFPGVSLSTDQSLALLHSYRALAEGKASQAERMFHTATCIGEGQLERGDQFLPIPLAELKDQGEKTTNSAFARWVDSRRSTLQALATQKGLPAYLDIDFTGPGIGGAGGRGRAGYGVWTVRSIDQASPSTRPEPEGLVAYRAEAVRPSLPFRPVFDPQGAPRRASTRALAALILATQLLAMVLLSLAMLSLLAQPVTAWGVFVALVFVAAAGGLAVSTRALWQIPERKLVIAPWWLLAWNEPFGVVHMGARQGPRGTMRPTALVRYTAECPVCGSDVELAEGGAQYPGRIVGRCLDAPSEHVLSFDPVTRTGRLL